MDIRKEKLQWQAEEDARTMARFQEIIQDKPRANRAIKQANKEAEDMMKRANAMKSAANIKAGGGRITRKKK